jgi:hypothetical protein
VGRKYQPIRIEVAPDSELALRLREAEREQAPLVVDTADAVYHLAVGRGEPATRRRGPIRRRPSRAAATRSRDGTLKAAGTWKDLDVEAFTAYVAERRRTSSRPPVRL